MLLKLLNKTSLIILALVIATGCKKLDLSPADRYTEANFWQVNSNVGNALNTVYNRINTSQRYFYNEALSDNAYAQLEANVGTPTAISGGSNASFSPDLLRVLQDWTYYYQGIYAANLFLDNADKNTTIAAGLMARMKAEARFLRAYEYSRLINWFGDVPLITKVLTPEEANVVTRTPKAEVLKFILDELDAAALVLPKKEDYAKEDAGRVTIGAAKALKARVLLYQGDRMEDVVAICEDLMNNQATNGAYSLYPDYSALFSDPSKEYNSEVMFDLEYVPGIRTYDEVGRLIPISAGAINGENYLAPTQELVDSYIMLNGKGISEAGSGYDQNNPYVNRDPRLTATIVYDQYKWTNPDGSVQTIYIKPGTDPDQKVKANEYGSGSHTPTGYYWRKYWDPTAASTNQYNLNLIVIRWADVLLMYAEAKNALGQMDAGVWNKTISPIRARAGFTDAGALSFPSSVNMTDLIRNERRVELALESLRIDDIRRWKIAEIVLNGWVHGARWGDPLVDNGYIKVTERRFDPAKHYLWPIPSSELQKDPNLVQNPNW
ncbi:MAG: RagB/SusD family nutrient uptake outer membrane protein [Chitinophagaceae bacterium]|nr:RagB/SusD family nutrient uptake outer membrane protein [Chitinophagaceae bacterium]